ncbi:hypothetical protein FQR65_LT06018 [Abscondita terminalis]|nr:hypothetical protein FQR65_LT06018 [Abscondita terminalis]
METLKVRKLSEELQKKANDELNEVSENVVEDVKYIREWLKKQQHILIHPDDQFIVTFLRGCKFNFEKTKEKIDAFYSTKTLIPEYFRNRNPFVQEIQSVLKSGVYWIPLPKFSDPLAPRLFYQCGKSQQYDMVSTMRVILMVMDILLHEDDSFIVNGYSVIQYLDGFSSKDLSQISLRMLKNSYNSIVNRYPVRLKKFHFMNLPPSACAIYNILKPFVSQKIQSRVSFHNTNNFTELHEIYPKKELPIELGGDAYSVSEILDEWKTKIENNAKWLIENENLRSDETKRIGKINYDVERFGVDGSFKKLQID